MTKDDLAKIALLRFARGKKDFLVVQVEQFGKNPRLDLRLFFSPDGSDELFPTRKGAKLSCEETKLLLQQGPEILARFDVAIAEQEARKVAAVQRKAEEKALKRRARLRVVEVPS
jgi:hypothetical protein